MKWAKQYGSFIGYGLVLAAVTALVQFLELKWYVLGHEQEAYIGFIAVLFTALGIWLAGKIASPKKETIIIEKTVFKNPDLPFIRNESAIVELSLSKREVEVLELLASGDSNQEIADKLFISLSTVKTHISSLFEKLEVKRRIQAIEKAKLRGILPG